ncbi:MAG: histidine phosphatase family protein [Bacteroidota bacterium]
MKRIILVRHGKSSWEYDVADRDRPLKERGVNDAIMVAKKFNDMPVTIDYAYSSPANRALHTATIFLRNIHFGLHQFQVTESLYDFSGEGVKGHVKSLSDAFETILLFGHNYAFTTLANTWGDEYIDNVPTAGLVQIEFGANSWSTVSKGRTKHILFPKQLR